MSILRTLRDSKKRKSFVDNADQYLSTNAKIYFMYFGVRSYGSDHKVMYDCDSQIDRTRQKMQSVSSPKQCPLHTIISTLEL